MQREQWGSRFGFIMAAAGSAVGLGNIWKFPYLAGSEGGGAFLLLYLVIMVTIGVSVMMAEIAIGRAAKLNPVGAFKVVGGRRWIPVGVLGLVTSIVLLSFYSVVGGWTIAYLLKTFTGAIGSGSAEVLAGQFGDLVGSPLEPIIYHGLFMVLTILIVLLGVTSGIERSVKALMPLLFLLLLVLVIRSVTLPGAWEGVEYFLMPDLSQVNMGMVQAALGQAFFSLSLGMGAMITYGSYLPGDTNIRSSSIWVISLDFLVAFLAGLLVLPAVFAFSMDPGAGPGLTFITLPAVFGAMPLGMVFQAVFFAMLLIAALTSSISLLAIPVAYFSETFGIGRKPASLGVGLVIFAIGVPCSLSLGIWGNVVFFGMSFFDFLSYLVDKFFLPIGGILTALCAGWAAYGKVSRELENQGELPFAYLGLWRVVVRFIAPLAIIWVMIAGFAS
ncbi:sodium-dependent transporter [Pseudovibrio exalbescens]|uniref:Na+-dependent transporter n=1 Tax=Pseudovibrio exalbescens TaxID=197461 RepID=A0A1U7JKC1_9HYPH|nr:sodium-dependent transporter [Pseudovibrio exalbescens]OKL45190.1 Na+-dependent transporter [Pseudovibrio exalbescens]